jgi:hypothetical protein
MVYVKPSVEVFQDFSSVPQPLTEPLAAHLSGGHAQLIRYLEADEKAAGHLGQYAHAVDTAFDWPQRPAGGVVDQSYTKLFIDDALLAYWDSTDPTLGDTVTTVTGRTNRIRASATSFADNGADYLHDAAFLDRGVKVGDVVRLRATVASVLHELCSYVAGFAAETIAAIVGSVSAASSNAGAASAYQHVNQLTGAVNCVSAAVAATSTYAGLADGHPTETYTIRVLQGSAGSDATTAVLRVTSASGTDDVPELSPAAFGAATAIGTRGAKLRFHLIADSLSSVDETAVAAGVAPHDFVAGQEFQFVVRQNYTLPTVTAGSTYTGDADDTYLVEIYRGKGDSNPQFTARTVRGQDVSTPTTISSTGAHYPVGTKGLTVNFSSLNLSRGDKWYIPVTAAKEGARRTLILGHNLPQAVLDNGATAVSVELYIRKNVEISANRTGFAPLTNFEQSTTELTVKSGIVAYDESYTDGGELVALPVHGRCGYSQLYVQARYWLTDLAAEVTAVGSLGELDDIVSGALHPDNPLKYAASKALANANGVSVQLTAVCDPSDLEEWAAVLDLLDGRDGVYGLVPLTKDPAVWSLYQAHVETQSAPLVGHWRTLWLNGESIPTKQLVSAASSSDGAIVLAVVEDDPLTAGSQYTQVRVPTGNGRFVTNGVRAGDVVRYLYTTDGFGGATYTELVVDTVVNEDTLRLRVGLATPVAVAERLEIWRTLTAGEQAIELAAAGGFSDRRVRFVWPDTVQADGTTVAGYHLCAALAALAGGVVPQQGLTHLEINGFTSTPRTNNTFSRAQLDVLAEGGVWIVTQDPVSGKIYTRHAVTTGDTADAVQREELITRNLDSMSFQFLRTLSPYIGVSNVTDSLLELLKAELNGKLRSLSSANYVASLGPQLISGTLVELRPDAVLRDRVIVAMDLTLPFPLNNVACHLVLVA